MFRRNFCYVRRRNEVGEHPELGKWRMEISRGRWIAREGATNGPLYVNTAGNSTIDLPLEIELEIKESLT
ncbi:hypothetical protein HZH66_014302 [Vespula vulgaris]|uniref:Uncharacterized protein n=2 Tax=Vespula TaxID=7451 RepID=A0A834N2D1_VESPE|nr:hypothetical protein HZH66_014302 [Vespula vulgaris]KAF7394170.1 hypothetical protein H0235_016765 [Vespula pensylvanica]